jgi:hypothetical protein
MSARTLIKTSLTSPGKIVDPFIEHLPASRGSMYGLRTWLSKQSGNWKSTRAQAAVSYKYKDFNKSKLQFFAQDLFAEYHAQFAAGAVGKLKPLTTPQFFAASKRGVETAQDTAVKVTRFTEDPQVLQMRTVHVKPLAMRGMWDNPEYAQVTLRIVSEQESVGDASSEASGMGRGTKRRGARKGSKGSRAVHAAGRDVAMSEWLPGLSPSGQLYWWNTVTGKAVWQKPLDAGVVGKVPVMPSKCGIVEEILPGVTGRRVVNYMVLETSLEGEAPDWRICKV